METEGSFFPIAAAIIMAIGIGIVAWIEMSKFEQDTYDCTAKCPDMAHSIQINQKCYCEVK